MDLESRKLGDFSLDLMRFPHLQSVLDSLVNPSFLCDAAERLDAVNECLLSLIQKTEPPCFLLAAVNEFIESIIERAWLAVYSFSQFEFWLNNFSGLSSEENYLVRAKVMGKYIPREAYQVIFPIGMGKTYFGSHYVTAHNSPDLDTTVASFWGWADAFAARVGTGLHIWNVPGGPPESQVEIQFLFYNFLGKGCFDYLAKARSSLALSAVDLVTQKGVLKKQSIDSIEDIGDEKSSDAIILVDEEGYYLGDWRQLDVEGVRKVTMLLNNCIRWFASYFQRGLTSLFALDSLTQSAVVRFIDEIMSFRLVDFQLAKEFSEKQKKRISLYLIRVLGVEDGWNARFDAFLEAMKKRSLFSFGVFQNLLRELSLSPLFDENGLLIENRTRIFLFLEKILSSLEEAIQDLKSYEDRLGIAFAIKQEVFGYPPQVISHRAEVEEIRSKMGPLSYLTATMPCGDSNGKESVIGIVKASDLTKSILGTVSLRDFCNRDETKIPAYFEVISVIDHHKSILSTTSAPVAFIADAQSANALVAEMAFVMHDNYSTNGCSLKEIREQFSCYSVSLQKASDARILQRLLQKQMIFERKHSYFIDSQREYLEYLQYLYAILDDTDLLSKVSYRDVVCVASLLNRLKSLMLKREVQVISLDDLAHDEHFAAKAAKRILQNEEMYSLYQKIYESKERALEDALLLCSKGEASPIFADTKVQNGCNRVGQTKLFMKNFPSYFKYAEEIRVLWSKEANRFYMEHAECDLHMHMISTVPSAENVYAGLDGICSHKDELWIWIPIEEQAIEHLKSFLSVFCRSSQIVQNVIEVEFLGQDTSVLEQIFHESFLLNFKKLVSLDKKMSAPIAVLRYRAGLLNSRKAMISPCLPKLIN